MRSSSVHKSPSWLATLLLALAACAVSPGVPTQGKTHFLHGTTDSEQSGLADLWVSYQITVAEIDGVATHYRPEEPCLYYRITLPEGEHDFGLQLDYDSMTHSIQSEGVLHTKLRFAAGRDYRLIDLSSGTTGERVLRPWLLDGAPENERIEIRRGQATF